MAASIDWLEKLGWDESQVEDLRFLGYHYIRQGKYEIARVFYEGIIALTSEKPLKEQVTYDYETLGAIYLQLGNNARSLRYLERALRMDPKNTLAALNKVKALMALGRTKAAMTLARSLLKSKDAIVRDRSEALIMSQKLREEQRIAKELEESARLAQKATLEGASSGQDLL